MVWTLVLPQSFPLGLAMGILSSDALLRLPASGMGAPRWSSPRAGSVFGEQISLLVNHSLGGQIRAA